jgi:predicted metal-dependent phosphoesterase TrpH
MPRWRVPAALSAVVILAQLARTDPLMDVVSGRAPDALRLAYPVAHVLLAPLTLAADWLNGGSRGDLIGFAAWALAGYAFARIFLDSAPRRSLREVLYALLFLAGFAGFVGWGALLDRPIPRLVATDSALVVFDVHSHTAASHDGRPHFDLATNAAWHARAGFDAAFITDHNVIAELPSRRAPNGLRLLPGEELSLSGLHVLALGARTRIDNTPWNRSFDSTLLLLRRLAADTSAERPYLIASLPEYWRYHWGTDIGLMTHAGIEGFEIWTTSPKAMDLSPEARAEVVARAALEGHALFGATDMHGLGNAATAWNVMRLPGWDTLDDDALTAALLARFRADGPASHQVVAIRRWQASAAWAAPAVVPLNVLLRMRTMSPDHAAALIAWLWLPALAVTARRRRC